MNPFVPGLIAGLVFVISLILVKDCRIHGRKEAEAPADPQHRERLLAAQDAASHAALKAEHQAERELDRRRKKAA